MYALEVVGAPRLTIRRPLSARPITVGRSPDCDLVLGDASVSRRHAALWVQDGCVFIEDLTSRNGTFVDGAKVTGVVAVVEGQLIRLGHNDTLRVVSASVIHHVAHTLLALEEPQSKVRVLLGPDPLAIGSDRSCAVRLASGPGIAAVVVRQGTDEAWLGLGDEMEEIAVDTPFVVEGRTFTVTRVVSETPPTLAESEPSAWPYTVFATLDAPGGALARVERVADGARCELHGTNSAVLLYLLARAWSEDAARDVGPADRGWVDDDAVAVGVWGKEGPLRQLKVEVCRLRQELREAELDPWIVERRRGALRVRVTGVELDLGS